MLSERAKTLRDELVQTLIEDGVTAEEFALEAMPFAQMELFGHEFGKQVAGEIQKALVEAQAARLNEQAGDRHECPQCGRECRAGTGRRTLKTLDGEVEFSEPKCFCKKCRKSFFPST